MTQKRAWPDYVLRLKSRNGGSRVRGGSAQQSGPVIGHRHAAVKPDLTDHLTDLLAGKLVPTQIKGIDGVVAIAASGYPAFALK
jgi:hypothetical protein